MKKKPGVQAALSIDAQRIGVRDRGPRARRLGALVVAAGLLTVALPVVVAGWASAAGALVVDTLADGHDAVIDGICDAIGPETCTLRAAIDEANANGAAADLITFSVTGTHHLDPSLGQLGINGGQDVTIEGNGSGPGETVVSGSDAVRVFFFDYPGSFTVRDLRVQDGYVSDAKCCHGAGIFNRFGTLNLDGVVVADNVINLTFSGATGAGVASDGPLNVLDSTIERNTILSQGGSGAGVIVGEPATIVRSTIADNSTAADPWAGVGGIYFQHSRATPTVISNSTISGNRGGTAVHARAVGGIDSNASLVITNTTFANNTAGTAASLRVGACCSSVVATMTNVIVSGSLANCYVEGLASIVADHSIDSGGTCGFGSTNGNQSGTDPLLQPLADNGGPTPTHALSADSPALDAGDDTACPTIDQRGVARLQDGTGNGTGACDIGAYELVPPANDPPVATAGDDVSGHEGSPISLSGQGSDPNGDSLSFGWTAVGAPCSFGDETSDTTSITCTDDGPYTVMLTASDGALSDQDDVVVTVANVAPNVGAVSGPVDPVAAGVSSAFSASFSDPGTLDTHTATWDWGDGTTSPASVVESAGAGSVGDSHTYAQAGMYLVTLRVTDDDGASSSSRFSNVVVYDPDGGSVSGRGEFDSPAGAYAADTAAAGPASFAFVSKYRRGATTPTGTTKFHFETASFEFVSDSYQWLVVSGARAQYKGTGAVNDVGGFGFMITAVDGQRTGGGGVDRFRIKIWNVQTGDIAYDNEMGTQDSDSPSTALTRGRIMIHK